MPSRSVGQRVQKHRDVLRAQGLRPVQFWVPDTRAEGFAEECARQATLAAAADRSDPELTSFVDAALDDLGDRSRSTAISSPSPCRATSARRAPPWSFNPTSLASHATATVLPVTSTVTPAIPLFRLPLQPSPTNGLRAPSCVMIDKTISIRIDRMGSTIGRLDEGDMLRIKRALALFLGLGSLSYARPARWRRYRPGPVRQTPRSVSSRLAVRRHRLAQAADHWRLSSNAQPHHVRSRP